MSCVVRRCRLPRRAVGDQGFTLVETLVGILMLGIVMSALTAFFITALHDTAQSDARNVAQTLADAALGQVSTATPSELAACTANTSYWSAPAPGAAPYLANLATPPPVPSPSVPCTSSLGQLFSGTGESQTVSGQAYRLTGYLGTCFQPVGTTSTSAQCSTASGTGYVPNYRVVIAVSWSRGADCGASGCSYVTSTAANTCPDPLFNVFASPPPAPTPGMSVAAYPASVPYGSPVTLSVAGLTCQRVGQVSFQANGSTLCVVTLPASTCPTSTTLPPGTYSAVGTLSGAQNFNGASATTTFTVTQVTPAMTLSVAPGSAYVGGWFTFTAALPNGATGSVTVTNGASGPVMCTIPALSNGSGSCSYQVPAGATSGTAYASYTPSAGSYYTSANASTSYTVLSGGGGHHGGGG